MSDQPEYTTQSGPAQPAEGTVAPDPTPDVAVQTEPETDDASEDAFPDTPVSQEETSAQESDDDNPLAGMDMEDVVSALLQGKFSTDAAEQRARLTAAGYDPEEVKEAVQKRLAQRYE